LSLTYTPQASDEGATLMLQPDKNLVNFGPEYLGFLY
jgi:hypothetical protein